MPSVVEFIYLAALLGMAVLSILSAVRLARKAFDALVKRGKVLALLGSIVVFALTFSAYAVAFLMVASLGFGR